MNLVERKSLIRAAMAAEPLDMLLSNVRIVNVYTGEIEPGAIGVRNGRIVTLQAGLEADQHFDCGGRYALPGLIDSHVHIDSTLLTPRRLADLILPAGTTTMLVDPMEISNVAGLAGMQLMVDMTSDLPYHVWIEVSSRVPTAPGLETTGGSLELEDVSRILGWEIACSLGELDPSKVLGLKDEYLQKVAAAHALGKIANGHAAGLAQDELTAYACGGLADDHECVTYEDALARLRLGLAVLVREGSTERNLDAILKGMLENHMDTRHLMFCTDDKHPDDIRREGHINYMVNRAIELGCSPVEAVQMATINAAIHFRLQHEIGSLTPGCWADILLVDDIRRIQPVDVLVRGKWVVHDGKMSIRPAAIDLPDWAAHTVRVTRGLQAQDFVLKGAGTAARARVIGLYPDQIINRAEAAQLEVVQGAVTADTAQDVLKLAVVERYGKNGRIGITFVRGFGLKEGALASSVSHDHHNIVVVGTNDDDMALCVRQVEAMQGGLAAVAGGKVLATLPLPVAGLMSDMPVEDVIGALGQLTRAAQRQGCILPSPFMTLSFISLPTVPELGLTDYGLVDVHKHEVISPFIE